MSKNRKTNVLDTKITVNAINREDYISLTDIARFKDSDRTDYIIQNWLRNRNTVEFLGIWEQLNNPDFNPIEFDGIRDDIFGEPRKARKTRKKTVSRFARLLRLGMGEEGKENKE
jgi:hypothetical protein